MKQYKIISFPITHGKMHPSLAMVGPTKNLTELAKLGWKVISSTSCSFPTEYLLIYTLEKETDDTISLPSMMDDIEDEERVTQ